MSKKKKKKKKKSKKYVVRLTEEERAYLRTLIGRGSAPARTLVRARILLKANEGEGGASWSDAAIAEALEVGLSTVARVRQRYVSEGLEATLRRKAPDREYRRKLDGEQEARLIALACSEPPTGRKRWTLRMLAQRLVVLEVVDSISYETVRQTLKQTSSSPT
jgi:transposase